MFLLILLALIAVVYWYSTRNFNYWSSRGVKGPRPLPLLGNLLDVVLKERTKTELDNYQKYGNFYGYYMGNKPVLVVGEPELVKNILVKDFSIFPQRQSGSQSEHPVMKHNLVAAAGEDWKRIRTITSPTFTSKKMKLMYPLMKKCIDDFSVHLDDLANGESKVNIKDIFGNLTLDVIASAAFGSNLKSRNQLDSLFVKHARALFRVNLFKVILLRIVPKIMFRMVGVRPDARAEDSQNFYVNIAREIVENRKKSGVKVNDFLQLLIDADKEAKPEEKVDDGESHHVNEGKEELEVEKKALKSSSNANKTLSEDEIIAQAVTFLMAGYETTATTLTYATYELALNPHVQDKLYAEVTGALNSSGGIDYDVLCQLPYLDSVICETLRHHSPAVKTARVATEHYVVGDTGVTLFPEQTVDIPIYAIHHDEKYYPDPFKFDPERFMPQNRDKLVPYTYLPFGGGPRNCIGMRFSLLETKLALAEFIRKYKFFRCDETDVPIQIDPNAILSAPKNAIVGIEMRFK